MIWLLGIGKWLSGVAGALLGVIRANPWPCAVIALLCVSGALWHRGDRYRDKLLAANAQIEAGKQNVIALKAEKARVEQKQAAITERIDNETVSARAGALAASDDYARAHRCVQPPAVAATSGPGAGVPDVPAAPASAQASGAAAAMVAVPKWGVDACSLNSADLQKAYDWAQSIKTP